MSVAVENEDRKWTANKKAAQFAGSNLTRSGSVKDLIFKFSGSSGDGLNVPSGSGVKGQEQKEGTRSGETQKPSCGSEDRKNGAESESRMQDQDYSKTADQIIHDTDGKSKHTRDETVSQDRSQRSTDRPVVVVSGPVSPHWFWTRPTIITKPMSASATRLPCDA